MSFRAVCFVIMPFGRKPDAAGRMVDFDHIYSEVMAPAVEAAGLDGIRADEEQGSSRDDLTRSLDDGVIDELAVQLDGGETVRFGVSERGDDSFGPG